MPDIIRIFTDGFSLLLFTREKKTDYPSEPSENILETWKLDMKRLREDAQKATEKVFDEQEKAWQ